ncbi:unnamed protein product, partial [Aphanomyces euteiches]
MPTLYCIVVGEGSPFPVEIEDDNSVGILKDKIREKNKSTITCDAKELVLYRVDGLTQNQQRQVLFNGTSVDMSTKLLSDFDGSTAEMAEAFPISSYPQLQDSSVGKIHVLVVGPSKPSNAEPPRKKAKLIQKDVVYQGPVHTESFSVPMESIDA